MAARPRRNRQIKPIFPHPWRAALSWTALLLGLGGMVVLALVAVLPDAELLRLGTWLKSPGHHDTCSLCGMSRAMVQAGHGRWSAAQACNRGSLPLLAAVLVYGALCAVYVARQAWRRLPSRGSGALPDRWSGPGHREAGGIPMQIVSLIWGILSVLGMLVAALPCLGSLNWLNVPFAGLGGVVAVIALAGARDRPKGLAIAGLVCCAAAFLFGIARLKLGGGIF